ncbi:hypothetical protein [Enterococcus casseliflavus]|uniref:hypothetical protein n=1 Tax=Enterococcus casseliflavus TaxID=37734 RepID=UPI001433285E|nr:hypothetical protein [Enterococcus casseliflavus]NKD34147.1 hypothetical protein [Enterococcus casseliflavus]
MKKTKKATRSKGYSGVLLYRSLSLQADIYSISLSFSSYGIISRRNQTKSSGWIYR